MEAAGAADGGESIQILFAKVDKDQSGGIDLAEFSAAIKAAGLEEAEIAKLFHSADKDGNGTLDVDEFKLLVASSPVLSKTLGSDKTGAAEGDDAIQRLFVKVDKDRSGGIDLAEFSAAVKAAGMTGAEVTKLFNSADKDGNGTLAIDEFKTLISASPILSKALGTPPPASNTTTAADERRAAYEAYVARELAAESAAKKASERVATALKTVKAQPNPGATPTKGVTGGGMSEAELRAHLRPVFDKCAYSEFEPAPLAPLKPSSAVRHENVRPHTAKD